MIKGVVIFSVIISFIGVSIAQNPKVIDGVVAVVGEEIILKSDIENRNAQYLAQGYGGEGNLKCQILEELLTEKLLINQAAIDSIQITDQQVNTELDRRMRYFVTQLGGQENFEEFYEKSVLQFKDELRPAIKDLLLAQQMQGEITRNINITPSEVKSYFKKIPKDSIPYFNAEVTIAQIVKFPGVSEASEDACKEKLRDIRNRIVTDGQSFKTMARIYSQGPSAQNGGDLGFVGRGELVKEFEAVAFKLKPGEVSGIVKTKFGFHIVEMIERRGEQVNVRHILLTPDVTLEDLNKAEQLLDSIFNLVIIDSLTFSEAASLVSEDETTKNSGGLLLNQNDGTTSIPTNLLDASMAYVIDTMDVGGISRPTYFEARDGKQGFRLINYISKSPPHRASLETDYPKIQEAAKSEKQANYVDSWFKEKGSKTYVRVSEDYKTCDNLQFWMGGAKTLK
jgi:peptidyl-prolyl cis-trans isomerase SurA